MAYDVSGAVTVPSKAVPVGGGRYYTWLAEMAEALVPAAKEGASPEALADRERRLAKKRREVAGQKADRDTY